MKMRASTEFTVIYMYLIKSLVTILANLNGCQGLIRASVDDANPVAVLI